MEERCNSFAEKALNKKEWTLNQIISFLTVPERACCKEEK